MPLPTPGTNDTYTQGLVDQFPLVGGARWRAIISGKYYGVSGPHIPGTQAATAGLQYAIPFYVPVAMTADRLSCEVTTAGAAGSVVRLGIYNNATNDLPGTLLLDAGTVVATSTGVKEATISQALAAGLYWLSVTAQGGTPTFRTIGSNSQPPVVSSSFIGASAVIGMNCYYQTGITGALANWPASPTETGLAAMVKVRAV